MNNHMTWKYFLLTACFILLITFSGKLFAACPDWQPDDPDCACFDNSAAWDAGAGSPVYIQDAAIPTVGTREATGCIWPVGEEEDDNGKPYYQMILGMNSVAGAYTASYIITEFPDTHPYRRRMEWCSETISYWHRAARLPYFRGYKNYWWPSWMITNVGDLRNWYETEEHIGGHGRWIRSEDLDYSDFELGVTVPVPGSYMAYQAWDPTTDSWSLEDCYHSVMIDEMWVHRDGHGDVFQIEVSILEGNSGQMVKDTGHLDDLFSVTTQGSQRVGTCRGPDGTRNTADDEPRKIYGFGVDLNRSFEPVYDPSRLHYIEHPYLRKVSASVRPILDRTWDKFYAPRLPSLIAFAQKISKAGGPEISSPEFIKLPPSLPDGVKNPWYFPQDIGDVTIGIDLLSPYPIPLEGFVLTWEPGFIPLKYKVSVSRDGKTFIPTTVTDMSQFKPLAGSTDIPVAARLGKPAPDIRYVKLLFPKGTFTKSATLTELSFNMQPGPYEDDPYVDEELPVFVDIMPGECPNLSLHRGSDFFDIAILGTRSVDVRGINPSTITLNGKHIKPISTSISDVSTPYIGSPPGCHTLGADKNSDLVLKYSLSEVVSELGLRANSGHLPILVRGQLSLKYGGTPIVGQDYVFTGKRPSLLLQVIPAISGESEE